MHYTAQCSATQGPDALDAPPYRSGRPSAEPHSPCERQCQCASFRSLTAVLIAAALAGCDKKPPPAAQVRPVRTVTVERGAEGETVSLTGQVRAKDQVSLAFRLDGRMIKRPVNVGDVLKAGEIVAQLDPQNQQNALRTAQANLAVGRGRADAGPPDLRAAAAASGGRLDAAREIRRSPAGAC